MTNPRYKAILSTIVLLVALAIPSMAMAKAGKRASAEPVSYKAWVVLTEPEAVEMVRAAGADVGDCIRIAARHFRCDAVYWFERHEAEVEDDGSLVNETSEWVPVPAVCDVGLKGVRAQLEEPSPLKAT